MFRADLHTHSTCSDGTCTPKELLKLALEAGLQGLSITDHDSIGAYNAALFAEAKALGIVLMTGVEFSTRYEESVVHVLGYGVDIDSQPLRELTLRHAERRKVRNQMMLEKLKEKGFEIEYEELLEVSEQVVGRPHIAQVMVKRNMVKSVKEAFDRYLGDQKPCYVRGEVISTQETIDVIHRANGKAFIAHPHLCRDRNLIERLLTLPFDGIEAYYAKFSPASEQVWVKLAEERGLLISGGSDFHGSIKPLNSLGCSWVNEETFRKINGSA